ncbi:hypothetical protein M406DRAFT_356895 [Cryphonectria parasitica EP155]|uniref:BZIP domain-containing protein n=1 Tax=Cryphonectria parasitica (strain ATCC 38755 / EP155) TaxID=660469 RepID=A0A9P4Y2I6_CRYP1|nr:uncharacterized protein M406DRAFT_356895 [Cryphonectria parasitica EP155]KAF3765250.1 hypothetical protein M406DRAFT_356895 [Cryphonectria parasitica EP155]
MAFGQTWADSGEGFAAAPPLDLDFSFDPALIESLPDSIPDFFLVTPRNMTSNHDLQQSQQFQSLTLDPSPPQPSSSNLVPNPETHSRPSSPSESSPLVGGNSRAGAGRQVGSTRREDDPDVVLKRQRNTIAARKYRQKRIDRIKELEDALEDMTKDRDDLRLRLARQEAETAALKEMMHMNTRQASDKN